MILKKLVFGAVGIAIVGVVVVGVNRGAMPASRLLSNGLEVKLRKVSYGTNHVFVDKTIGHSLRWMLPERLTSVPITAERDASKLFAWVECQRPSDPTPLDRTAIASATLTDELGNLFEGQPVGLWRRLDDSAIYAVEFSLFPIHSKNLTLRLFFHDRAQQSEQLTAEFGIINPRFEPSCTLTAGRLPLIDTDAETTVTLTSLAMATSDSSDIDIKLGEVWMRAEAMIYERNRISSAWQVANVEIMDEIEHVFEPRTEVFLQDGRLRVYFKCGLSSATPWKLRFRLERVSDFEASGAVTVSNVALSSRASRNRFPQTVQLGKGEIIVTGVANHDRWTLPFLEASSSLVGQRITLLRAVDNNGQLVAQGQTATVEDGTFFFKLPLGLETVSATFAVSRERSVEFICRPERMDSERDAE